MSKELMFTLQDLRNIQVFLNRVDIKGNEALALAELQIKTNQMVQASTIPPETVTPLPVAQGKS